AARCRAAALGAFEEAQSLLECRDSRVGVARVDEARAVIGKGGFRFLGGGVDVARAHVDRLAGLHELAAQMSRSRQQGSRTKVGGKRAESLGHGPHSSAALTATKNPGSATGQGSLTEPPTF